LAACRAETRAPVHASAIRTLALPDVCKVQGVGAHCGGAGSGGWGESGMKAETAERMRCENAETAGWQVI
jgi:hypothetical protein